MLGRYLEFVIILIRQPVCRQYRWSMGVEAQ